MIRDLPFPYLPKKPNIPSIPKEGRAKAMTIAAGFKFRTGIMLCADTEQTEGDWKFPGSKIITKDLRPSLSIAFALSGTVSYATMTAQDIIGDLETLRITDHASAEIIIRKHISKLYTELLYQHPRASFGDGPVVDYLIAIWAENRTRLLISTDTAVNVVDTYECIGTGRALARYLIKPLYMHDSIDRQRAEMIAVRTLVHVKDNAAHCGKDSEFVILEGASGEIHRIKEELILQHNLPPL